MQALLSDAGLCAALQLSFDLHYMEASLQAYTTPAGARLLHTCHSLLCQAVTHCLCDNGPQCRAVQRAYGDYTAAQSIAAWLSQLGKQAVDQLSSFCSYTNGCLADGAAVGLAASAAPPPAALSRLASTRSGLSHSNSIVELPASPRRRLVPNKPVSYVHSRLIGMTSSSAAALASLQGKYGMQHAMASSPRSPVIKAVHRGFVEQAVPSPRASSSDRAVNYGIDEPETSVPSSHVARHLHTKTSRLKGAGSNEFGLSSNSRTGSILDPKARHCRHKPPKLQPQSSISLNAMAALNRPFPLQIPP